METYIRNLTNGGHMGKARPRKHYSDPYGKNRPLNAWQRRCRTAWCRARVFVTTWVNNDGLCANCAGDKYIKEQTKDVAVVL